MYDYEHEWETGARRKDNSGGLDLLCKLLCTYEPGELHYDHTKAVKASCLSTSRKLVRGGYNRSCSVRNY